MDFELSAIESSPTGTRQSDTPLLTMLQTCAARSHAAFYMPGHKRGQGISARLAEHWGIAPFQADLAELPELDNLFAPQGVIQEAQELAAEAFGAARTCFLVNGSTSGILTAVMTLCNPGDKLILPRNSHRSAIAALILSGAMPIFVEPEYDPIWGLAHGITPAGVRAALSEHPDVKAMLALYPTYHGSGGDLAGIAAIAHQHHIPLIVDEAHGAHFAFHQDLPSSALAVGADVVVQSIHKTLGALTQASMLHVGQQAMQTDWCDRLTASLQLVQSTSPSYLLLASLDAARQQIATQGEVLLTRTLELADRARAEIREIAGVAVLEQFQKTPGFAILDRTRLTIDVSGLGLTGFEADDILHHQYGVTAELPSLQQLTFILSIGNTAADIDRLVQSLRSIAKQSPARSMQAGWLNAPGRTAALPAISPRQAFFAPTQTVPIAQAIDRISAELICPYPPGIPVLIPGEVVTQSAIGYLQKILAAGGILTGCADANLHTLKIVKS